VNLDSFGPGVGAAFLGARVDNSSGAVWFYPPDDRPIKDLHFEFDPDNLWLRRVLDICRAAMERWQGLVLVGMTDLGGTLDILSTFRPAEQLHYDLHDHPAEVERLVWEIHELWHRLFGAINDALQPTNPGYSDWGRIYSDAPAYMLQSDFSYMLGPRSFREFVLPELKATCRRLPRSFYHLDGVGQLKHLDALLAIEELDGIQWVPGDGQAEPACWVDVYRKILDSGKKLQVVGGLSTVERILPQVGHGGRIDLLLAGAGVSEEADVRARLVALSRSHKT
jgi:5-methyltetrahydrofolate--homocysteine methyltransferase